MFFSRQKRRGFLSRESKQFQRSDLYRYWPLGNLLKESLTAWFSFGEAVVDKPCLSIVTSTQILEVYFKNQLPAKEHQPDICRKPSM